MKKIVFVIVGLVSLGKPALGQGNECPGDGAEIGIDIGGDNGKGDYDMLTGRDHRDIGIYAMGRKALGDKHLYGSVRYGRGIDKHIGWNATREVEDYRPYIATDSIGGNTKWERYGISGGYDHAIGSRWVVGVTGHFNGEQAYRTTDPRALNTTTHLDIKAYASVRRNGHVWDVGGGYGRGKQHLRLRYWRPGEQERFFVSYGFGLYDIRVSAVMFGYSRMYYINEALMETAYRYDGEGCVRGGVRLGARRQHMETEESDIKKLYEAKTWKTEGSAYVEWHGGHHAIGLCGKGNGSLRRGYENMYEPYLVDYLNSVWDYRVMATRQDYRLADAAGRVGLYGTLDTETGHRLHVEIGEGMTWYRERYLSKNFEVRVKAHTPYVDMGYRLRRGRHETGLGYGVECRRLGRGNRYDVDMSASSVVHLDFQQCWAAYAWRMAEGWVHRPSVEYVFHKEKYALGVRIEGTFWRGKRKSGIRWEGEIGYDSSAPRIRAAEDVNERNGGKIGVFVRL